MELGPLANRYHGWVWAALPPGCRRVRVVGDPGLAELLRAADIDVGEEGPGPRTMLVAFGRPPSAAELEAVEHVGPRDAVAVAWPGNGRDTARVTGRLRTAGLETHTLAVASRHRRALDRARSVLARRARWRGHTVVIGASAPARWLLQETLARAAHAVDMELTQRAVTVLSTGTVLAELASPSGERFALRIAGGPAAGLLERAGSNVAAVLAADPPDPVGQRLPVPLAVGRVHPVIWTLEEWISGDRPTRLSPALWSECLAFLVGLHRTGAADATRTLHAWSLEPDFRALERFADERARRTLARLQAELQGRLADVPRGWAHGDFWPANLLVDGRNLVAVLDWDSATPGTPALLDVMHLLLLSDRRARRLTHGSRSLRVLLPLARDGGDARMRRYCAATATPSGASTLEGLALAYWVSRVGRDLRTFENRPSRRAWMEANLHQPVRELARRGW
jgi:aminoglycoside phosphotransferase (APT) family kinase protein